MICRFRTNELLAGRYNSARKRYSVTLQGRLWRCDPLGNPGNGGAAAARYALYRTPRLFGLEEASDTGIALGIFRATPVLALSPWPWPVLERTRCLWNVPRRGLAVRRGTPASLMRFFKRFSLYREELAVWM